MEKKKTQPSMAKIKFLEKIKLKLKINQLKLAFIFSVRKR